MKKQFAFIVPYIGKFPHWFQLWLDSCGRNPLCDWLIFTDDETPYDYPENVIVRNCTFQDLKERFQRAFDFPISLEHPYRFCDFRPSYGKIFADVLEGYSFWGFCDTDLIWGNLSNWLTEEKTKDVDRISHWGHCTLLRNCPHINNLYTHRVEGIYYYRDVYANHRHVAFDEECGFNIIARAVGIKELVIPFFDIMPTIQSYGLEPTYVGECFFTESMHRKLVRVCEDGVFAYGIGDDDKLVERSFAYVHLQKRPMENQLNGNPKSYLVIPNSFISDRELSLAVIKQLVVSEKVAMLKRRKIVWKSRLKYLLGK